MRVGTEPPPALNRARLRVGNWTVEPALNQLSAAGKTVKLEPKAMATLIYLANRPGQVVSREALLSAVWPGVVVGDDSLDRKSTRLNSSHTVISYAVFCLKTELTPAECARLAEIIRGIAAR